MICKCSEHGLRYQLVYKTKITRTVGLYVAVSSLISQLSCCKPSSVLADKFILWCKKGKLPWQLLAFLDSLRVSALERQVVMDSLQSIRQKARVSVRQITQSPQQVLPDHKYTLLLFLLSLFDCCIRTFGHIIYV